MQLPRAVETVMRRMESAGYRCHIVGGCVRDSLMGLTPHDWDLTTNALPEQVVEVFSDLRVIPTGAEHGTVTVLVEGTPIEITTYRVDGTYTDHRRPDSVRFVTDIKDDLSRRDFTVNAMAWNVTEGLCDPCGGADDLRRNVLRCVGDPDTRFTEDALRILRALRFAATYGFTVDPATADALLRNSSLLASVAAERIRSEMDRLLVGKHAGDILRRFASVIHTVIPELSATVGVWQYNPYHDKDVWEHTVAALESAPPVLTVRLALLLHDIAKPYCFEWIRKEDGFGHFPHHPHRSAAMAEEILRRLRYDNHTIHTVCALIRHHDDPIPETDAGVRRWLYNLGECTLCQLLDVKEGDCDGHAADMPTARREELYRLRDRIARVISEKQCISMDMLAVGGRDLLEMGIPKGEQIGTYLQHLLDAVLDGTLPNDREILLQHITAQNS